MTPRPALSTLDAIGLTVAEIEAVLAVRNAEVCRALDWCAVQPARGMHERHESFPPPAADAPMPTQTDAAAVYLEPFAFDTPARVAALVDRVRNGASTLYPVEGRALVAEIDRLRAELAAVKRGAP